MRRAAGTRTVADLVFHPGRLLRQFAAMAGSTPPAVAVDQAAVELLEPMWISAMVRRRNSWRQIRVCFDPAQDPPMVWQSYRVFRPYGREVPFPLPARVVDRSAVVGPGSWKVKKSLFTLLLVVAGPEAAIELAVPRVDVPTFIRQLDLASSIWTTRRSA
jgi:hypothetical protein